MELPARETILNRYVGVLVVLQVVGAVLVMSALDHDPDPLAAWIQELPPGVRSLLSPLIVVAIPAMVLTVLAGLVVFAGLESIEANTAFVPTYGFFVVNAYVVAIIAVTVLRRGRVAPGEGLPATPTPVTDSRWWYWIAAYVVYVGIVLGGGTLAFWFGLALLPAFGTPWSALLVAVGAVVFVLAVVAVYFEGRGLRATDAEWQPAYRLYMVGIALGTLLYPLGPLVALHYLHRRRRRLGVRNT